MVRPLFKGRFVYLYSHERKIVEVMCSSVRMVRLTSESYNLNIGINGRYAWLSPRSNGLSSWVKLDSNVYVEALHHGLLVSQQKLLEL